jgi:hypothetical protein
MKGSGFVLFIDDFHYISREAQVQLAQHIKEAIRQGVVIICASVSYHSDDVLRANADLRGRIVTIDVDYWQPGVLQRIAEQGFRALHASANRAGPRRLYVLESQALLVVAPAGLTPRRSQSTRMAR